MIRLDRFFSVNFFYPILKRNVHSKKVKIPILMYHSVSEDFEGGIPAYYRLSITPDAFLEQMCWLHRHGYKTIDLHQALDKLAMHSMDANKYVVITFDDGYKDFLTNAWPVLKQFGQKATVFLPTGFIGDKRKFFKNKECLTWSEIRSLHKAGISFGSHTVNHIVLHGAPWVKIRKELKESRQILEEMIGTCIPWFSYPYAFPKEDRHFVSRLRKDLVGQGYQATVTTAIGRVCSRSDPMQLKRLPINSGDDLRLFKAKLIGAYDWMAAAQRIVRIAKSIYVKHTKPINE